MTIRNSILALSALAAFAGLPEQAGATNQGRTTAPTQITGLDYTFRRPLYNGRGAESLSDLRGTPVLIEYWSHRCSPCVGSAVPDALAMQQEHGDDLQVVLCEAGRSSSTQVLSYALSKKWLTTGAMWTTEHPIQRETVDVPYFVLLDAEGEIAMEGIATENHKQLEDKVAELVKATAKGPRELPRELAKAMAAVADGQWSKAREIAQQEVERADEDGVRQQEAKRVLATIEERLESKLRRTRWMLDNGYPIEASEALDDLEKGVKGWEDPALRVAEMAEALETPEMKRELEAQKALAKIERKLFDDPDVRWVKQLQKIVEKYPRTKTAERAKQLAKIASI